MTQFPKFNFLKFEHEKLKNNQTLDTLDTLGAGVQEFENYLFEERAAIMEYDGNINKDEAERLALEEVTQITARKQRENE